MTDLKTLAMAANSAHPCTSWYDSESLIYMGYDDDCDASYIAAASPDAILELLAERDRLRDALNAASRSLETISMLAGRKTYGNPPIETLLGTFEEVRAYATSRAGAGLQALEAAP